MMHHKPCIRERTLAVETFVRMRSCDRRSGLDPIAASLVATRAREVWLLFRAFDKRKCVQVRAEPFRAPCLVSRAMACSSKSGCPSCMRDLRSRSNFATRQLAPLSFGGMRLHLAAPLRQWSTDRLEGRRTATAHWHDTYSATKNAPGDSSSGGE